MRQSVGVIPALFDQALHYGVTPDQSNDHSHRFQLHGPLICPTLPDLLDCAAVMHSGETPHRRRHPTEHYEIPACTSSAHAWDKSTDHEVKPVRMVVGLIRRDP